MCIDGITKILDFSLSPIFPKDRRYKALTFTGGHIGFKCTEEVAPGMRLGTFETKMSACKGRCSILTILRKNRGL